LILKKLEKYFAQKKTWGYFLTLIMMLEFRLGGNYFVERKYGGLVHIDDLKSDSMRGIVWE